MYVDTPHKNLIFIVVIWICVILYTQYVLQGTAYKGQLWQLVEFGKKLRDRLVFFPKIKGQDTIYQGTKD